jgi:hypothetical protein
MRHFTQLQYASESALVQLKVSLQQEDSTA